MHARTIVARGYPQKVLLSKNTSIKIVLKVCPRAILDESIVLVTHYSF